MYSLATEVVAIEKNSGQGVLARSQDLTSGIRGRIFMAMSISFVLVMLFSLVSSIPLFVLDHWLLATMIESIQDIGFAFVSCVFLVIYLDRIRVERHRLNTVNSQGTT
jgi:hypothetical protein